MAYTQIRPRADFIFFLIVLYTFITFESYGWYLMASLTISTRIDTKIAKKLDSLSKATRRSKSFLAAEAIEKYIDDQAWQIEAINKGIKEADNGNFASDKEVKKRFSKWGINAD